MLLAAIELVAQGMHKVFSRFAAGQARTRDHAFLDSHQVKQHSTIRLMTEMVETFMSFLRMMVDQKIHQKHWQKLHSLTSELIQLSHHIRNPKFNFECDVLKIAVYGGQSTLSTLYFFQEDLFPNTKLLDFLLMCGANVNCIDIRGDTPLHYSLDCSKPDPKVIRILLDNGGHIDLCNRSGVSPYDLLLRAPFLGINPFPYMSLKCYAARAIARHNIPYKDEIPQILEEFIPLHGVPKSPASHEKVPLKMAP
jgi:Fem-1 family protein b